MLDELVKDQVKTPTGAAILSVDKLGAEPTATLHALNSREPGGWRENIKKLFDTKTGNLITRILKMFYVGYGHKSIGDCGEGDVFVDDLSMLAANAAEHNALFNGQETSSRYVILSEKGFIHTGDNEIDHWTARWMKFYADNIQKVVKHLAGQYPCPDGENSGNWDKAITSRACDIMGAFLPSGAKTNMSTHMNLRQFADFLQKMVHHPLPEVKEIAESTITALQKSHPNSFEFKRRESVEEYTKRSTQFIFGGNKQLPITWLCEIDFCNDQVLEFLGKEMLDRPQYTELPLDVAVLGQIKVRSMIDYRSFRDLHRHRSIKFAMPLVTAKHGFNNWYLGMLPSDIRDEAGALISEFTSFYEEYVTEENKFLLQYAVPMGFLVQCDCVMNLDGAVYVTDLRSGMPVHPTARRWAIMLADELRNHVPDLQLHTCRERDRFVSERGKHDIVKK